MLQIKDCKQTIWPNTFRNKVCWTVNFFIRCVTYLGPKVWNQSVLSSVYHVRRCQNFNLVVGGGLLFETALYDIPLCPSYIIPRPIFSVITFFHFLHFSMALSINSFFFLCVYLLFRTSRPSLYGRIYLCSALILWPLSFYLRKSSFLESGFFL